MQDKVHLIEERDKASVKLLQLQSLEQELASANKQLDVARREAESAQEMFVKERQVRRKLHEQLQVRRGHR